MLQDVVIAVTDKQKERTRNLQNYLHNVVHLLLKYVYYLIEKSQNVRCNKLRHKSGFLLTDRHTKDRGQKYGFKSGRNSLLNGSYA